MKEEDEKQKAGGSLPSEPGRPKVRRPKLPRPPETQPNTPLLCRERDIAPSPENGTYAEISRQKKEPVSQNECSSECEKENQMTDSNAERESVEVSG